MVLVSHNEIVFELFFLSIEEENYGKNADMITKHFIAEGIVCDHSVLIADVEMKPETIVSNFVYMF